MKIVYVTHGSRGDTQPHLALAIAMARAGHSVRLWMAQDYKGLVPSGVKGLQIVESPHPNSEGLKRLEPVFASGDSTQAVIGIMSLVAEQFEVNGESIKATCEGWADVLVTNAVMNEVAFAVSEVLSIRLVKANVQPIIPTAESVFFLPLLFPKCLNMFLWKMLCLSAMPKDLAASIVAFKSKHGVTTPARPVWDSIYRFNFPTLLGFSPQSIEPPSDWAGHDAAVTGDWILDPSDLPEKVTPELKAFLAKEQQPPVYIGWGSMAYKSGAFLTELALRALRRAGQRGIIFRGSNNNDSLDLGLEKLDSSKPGVAELLAWAESNVLVIGGVSHEWLFPQVSAIVHHGGAGTSAAAMRSGVPSMITPFTLDQFGYARVAKDLGLGPAPLPTIKDISPQALGDAVLKAVTQPEYRMAAQLQREKLLSNEGTTVAVKAFEKMCEARHVWNEEAKRLESGQKWSVQPPSFACCVQTG